jgi:hypothetical protein
VNWRSNTDGIYRISFSHTSKKLKTPPEEARKRFATLVTINELDYKFKLTTAFQKALDDTEAAVTRQYAHPPQIPPAPITHPPGPAH